LSTPQTRQLPEGNADQARISANTQHAHDVNSCTRAVTGHFASLGANLSRKTQYPTLMMGLILETALP